MTKELIVTLYVSIQQTLYIYNNGLGLLPHSINIYYFELYFKCFFLIIDSSYTEIASVSSISQHFYNVEVVRDMLVQL